MLPDSYNLTACFVAGLAFGLGIAQTISSRRSRKLTHELDLARQRLLSLDEAEKSKLQDMARLSHDLRTPMNAIIGLTGLLEQGVSASRQKEVLQALKKSSNHLVELIGELCDPIKSEDQSDQTPPSSASVPKKVVYPNFRDAPAGRTTFHILLVEDYAANVMVASALIEQLGCTYEVAKNGKQALEMLHNARFDLVLLDVQMPVMDGIETTRQIRHLEKERKAPRIPIIGVTAGAMADDRDTCLSAGMDDYLSKPYVPAEFEGKIKYYMSQNSVQAKA